MRNYNACPSSRPAGFYEVVGVDGLSGEFIRAAVREIADACKREGGWKGGGPVTIAGARARSSRFREFAK